MRHPRVLVLLFVIVSAFYSMQCMTIDPKSKHLSDCCSIGTKHASIKSCKLIQYDYSKVPSHLHNHCYQRIIECCNIQRNITECYAGNDAAYAGKPCNSPSKKFMGCCEQCKHGIELAKLGRNCDADGVNADKLERMARIKCYRDHVLSSEENDLGSDSYSDEDDEANEDDFQWSILNNRNKKEPCGDFKYCDHNCIIAGGVQRCSCNEGYELQPDGRTCKASQIPSSIVKNCDKGFYWSDFGRCEDINECEIEHNGCGKDAICINREGSYECKPKEVCMDGFRFNRKFRICEDINECQEFSHNCKHDQHCNNTIGGFFCSENCSKFMCHSRPDETFVSNPRRPTSRPSFESTSRPFITYRPLMDPVGITKGITTTERTLNERCPTGYERDIRDICVDIDECKTINPCPSHLRCLNTPGSYSCSKIICPPKSRLEGSQCVRIDPCSSNPCPLGYDCINLVNNYTCKAKNCDRGYKRHSNGECIDINECDRPNICQNGVCMNTQGSFKCHCNNGFKSDQNNHCVDIDECVENNQCDQKCYNTYGSYRCGCDNGYRPIDHQTCEDINECEEHGKDLCLGQCKNLDGSYECECPDGFRKDGIYCTDVDECVEHENICGKNIKSECLNIVGSYKCMQHDCSDGYRFVHDDHHKYCRMMMPCGYKNDDKICEKPWMEGHTFISRVANCSSMRLLVFVSNTSNINNFETEIVGVRVRSIGENVKGAEFGDFSVHKTQNGYELIQKTRLNGPQEIEVDILMKYINKHSHTRRHKIILVISEYPFYKFSDKLIRYQSTYCPFGNCDNKK